MSIIVHGNSIAITTLYVMHTNGSSFTLCLFASLYTVYGKIFQGETLCDFSVNRKSFPLELLAVYST